MKVFQDKFNNQMAELTDELNRRLADEREYMDLEIYRAHTRMQRLEGKVSLEKTERIQSLDTQLTPIRADLASIQNSIDAERNARV